MYVSGFFILWCVSTFGVGAFLMYREGYKSGLHAGRAQGWRQSRRLQSSSTSPRGVN